MNDERADKTLSLIFPQYTRTQWQHMIEVGAVSYRGPQGRWLSLKKSGQKMSEKYCDPRMWKINESLKPRFVSRGGDKLWGALEHWSLDVNGHICLDIGLSTGGFSDCLLQKGAKRILGIDVGREQLDSSLLKESRLVFFDKINAKNPLPAFVLEAFFGDGPSQEFDTIVVDVSFISLSKVLPNLVDFLHPKGRVVALVKPQFELGKLALNKQGIIKNNRDPFEAVEGICEQLTTFNLQSKGWVQSSLLGDDGNTEFLLWMEPMKR